MQKSGLRFPKTRIPLTVFTFAVLMLASVSLLLFSTRGYASEIKFIGLSIFSGVRGGIHEVTSFFSRTVLSIRELADLRREHAELLRMVARFEELERTSAEIIQENVRLREQLGFAQTLRFNYIPAQITGRDPSNLFSALVINQGRNAGVREGMAVIAWQGGTQALVGKVIRSGAFESLIMPVFDSSSMVSSRFSVSRFEGIVEGRGSPDIPLVMRFIPRRARDEISIGDLIISSGMGGIYPAGINIGRVSNIILRDHEITMEAELEAVIDFSRLEYVFLVEAIAEEAIETFYD